MKHKTRAKGKKKSIFTSQEKMDVHVQASGNYSII